jgi:transcriptional regulator with XRE-family HTH domain
MIPAQTGKEIIGSMIRNFRKEKNLTQQQLADFLGVDRQYVWRLENGGVNFTMDYLDKVITKLNCVHADFLNIYRKDEK